MSLELNTAARLPFPVTNICFGTSPLGDMPDTYGYSVDAARARETISSMLSQPHSFIDTSRNYGDGRSEARIGDVIRERGGVPAGCVLATKVDRNMKTNVLDADRARRSVEESLEALAVGRLQILHLHDPEHCADLNDITRSGGALDEVFRMKEEGLVGAVGLAMGNLPMMTSILPDWDFDALISHNRFTLLNRSADRMYTDAHARGIAIFNAAPYASGILAKGSNKTQKITYQDATEAQLKPVHAIEEVCARHNVPTGVAALQFSMRDPRVTSTIVGVSKSVRVQQTLEWAQMDTPDALWAELGALPFSSDDPEAERDYKPC
ncbi:aldo/keto reductase [Rhodobacteraceae bacterium]|nr:aldo/keto reductase [Paracoccaceae bacterium]